MLRRFLPVVVSLLFFILPQAARAQSETAESLQAKLQTLTGVTGLAVTDLADDDVGQVFKIGGGRYTVSAFPAADGSLNFAISIANAGMNTLGPIGASDPLNGVHFTELVLILSEADNTSHTAALPRLVRSALALAMPHGTPDALTLSEGLNVFGLANAGTGGFGRFLGTDLGLDIGALALEGRMATDALAGLLATATPGSSHSAAGLADWRNALSLSGSVGTLAPPGFPSEFVHWPSVGTLSLAGAEGNLSARIESHANIYIAGDTLKYDLAFSGAWSASTETLALAGALDTAELVTFGDFRVSGLKLEGHLADNLWDYDFLGQVEIGGKTLDVEILYEHGGYGDADYMVEVSGDIGFADLVPGVANLPGLADVEVEKARIGRHHIEAVLAADNHTYQLFVHPDDTAGTLVVIMADQLNLGAALPGGAATLLDDMYIDAPVLVLELGTTGSRTLDMAELPQAIAQALEAVAGSDIEVSSGLNVFAKLDMEKSEAASTFSQLGITDPVPLRGSVNPQALVELIGHAKGALSNVQAGSAEARSILSGLNLTAPLPSLAIPGLPSGSRVRLPNLTITGEDDGTLKVAIAAELDTTVSGTGIVFTGELDLTTGAGGRGLGNFTYTGTSAGTWAAPFGLHWLQLEQVSVKLASTLSGGKRDVAFEMDAVTDIGASKGVPIEVDMTIANAAIAGAKFLVKAPIGLQDLPSLSHISALHSIKLESLGIEMEGSGNGRKLRFTGALSDLGAIAVEGLTLTSANMTAEEDGNQWHIEIAAEGDLNGKAATVSAVMDTGGSGGHAFTVTITGDHTIADLVGAGAGPLDSLKVEEIVVSNDVIEAKVELGGQLFDFAAFKLGDSTTRIFSVAAQAVDLGAAVPKGGGSFLDGVMLADAALVVARSGATANNVAAADLPGDLATVVGDVAGEQVNLALGVNVFATLDVRNAAHAADAFGKLGIDRQLPIKGTIDPAAMLSAFKHAAENASAGAAAERMADLDLSASIPHLTVPGLPSGSSFDDTTFSVRRADDGGIEVTIATELALKLKDDTLNVDGQFDLATHSDGNDIVFTGSIPAGMSGAMGLDWLHVDSLELRGEVKTSGSTRTVEIDLNGEADLGKAKGLQVATDLMVSNSQLQGADLTFTGQLSLADLPALAAMPRGNAITLDGFKLSTRLDGNKRTNTIDATLLTAGLVDLPGFDFSSGSIAAAQDGGDWDATITAKAKLHDKDIDVTAEVVKPKGGKADFAVTLTDDLTVAELLGAGQSIPGLDALSISTVVITASSVQAALSLNDTEVDVLFYRPDNDINAYVALAVSDYNVGDHIPGAESTVLADVAFSDVAMLVVPSDGAENGVRSADLPEIISAKVTDVAGATVNLKSGLNLYGKLDVDGAHGLADVFQTLGITDDLAITGSVDPRALVKKAKNTTTADAKSWLRTLDFTAPLPSISIPGMPKSSSFANSKLTIDGGGDSGTVQVGVATELTLELNKNEFDFAGEFDFTNHDGDKTITFKGSTEEGWHSPFGIAWLYLEGLALDVSLAKASGGKRDVSVTLDATTDFGKSDTLDVAVIFDVEGGTLEDGEIKIDSNVPLSDVPGLKAVPHSDHFTLTELVITKAGIAAKSTIDSVELDVAAVKGANGWSFLIDKKGGSMSDLVPFAKGKLLESMHMSDALFILSEGDLVIQDGTSIGDVVAPMLQPMLDLHPTGFTIPEGVALAAIFDPAGHKDSKAAFAKLGLTASTFVLGEVDGVFGGTPLLQIEAFLPTFGEPKGLPKFLKWPDGITPAFFLRLVEGDVAVGIEVDMDFHIEDDTLTLQTKLEMELGEEGPSMNIVGDLDGKWQNAMGIHGFDLGDLAVKVGITAADEVTMGFEGNTTIGGDKVEIAAESKFQLAALGFPDAIAFKGTIDRLGPVEIIDLMEALAGVKGRIKAKDVPFFELSDVVLAFATPGAIDPDLDLTTAGFAGKGTLSFMGHNLGQIQANVMETKGIDISGSIADMHLGPISIYDNNFSLKAEPTGEPELTLNANSEILGAKSSLAVDIKVPAYIKFAISEDFGSLGKASLDVEGVGFDTSTGKASNADFTIKGELDDVDFFGWLDGTIKDHVDDVLDEVDAGFKDALDALRKAEASVHGLDSKIEKARAKVRAERDRTVNKLHQAESKVDGLKKKEDSAKHSRDHCHWYQAGCKIKYEAEYLGYKAAREVAEGVLHAIEKAVEVMPVDLDPRVAGLLAERDTAIVGLRAAEFAVEGADVIDKVAELVFNAIVDGLNNAKPIEIYKIAFEGSLGGAVKHDEPWLLSLDYALFKHRFANDFVFKLKDPGYDAKQLGFVAFQTIDKVIELGLKDLPKPVRDAFHEAIGKRLNKLEEFVEGERKKYAKAFETVESRESALKQTMAQADQERAQRFASEIQSALDVEPASQELKSVLLEVGHSGLCLHVAGGTQVDQQPCKDNDRMQRWETKDSGSGFVFFVGDNKCLKPLTNNPDLGVQLLLDACDTRQTAQSWKVQSQDGDFFRVANKASQKCLHFVDPDANPGAVKGEWWPCHGADAQAFRVLGDTQPVYHGVNTELGTVRGRYCYGSYDPRSLQSAPSTPFNPFHVSPFIDPALAQFVRRYGGGVAAQPCSLVRSRLLNSPEGKGFQFNYVEDLRGFLKIVDGNGNCIYPSSSRASDLLVAKPCDHGDDQYWEKDEGQDGFRLKNAKTGLCMDVKSISGASFKAGVQANCNTNGTQAMVFGAPKNPLVWTPVPANALKGIITNLNEAHSTDVKFFNGGRYDRRINAWTDLALVCSGTDNHKVNVIGMIGDDGLCHAASSQGKQDLKLAGQSPPGQIALLTAVDGADWTTAHPRIVPFDAPPGAYEGEKALYICRALVDNDIYVGWAADGICHYSADGYNETDTFQYLVAEPGVAQHAQATSYKVVQTGVVPDVDWQGIAGAANDIAVGAKGAVWVIGNENSNANSHIYGWTGEKWRQVPGGAARIAADSAGRPWVVNHGGAIYRHDGDKWVGLPGSALDIGIGGKDAVWVIGTDNQYSGGAGIYHWTGHNWTKISGSALRIAVDPQGLPWVVNKVQDIYRYDGKSWHHLPGKARDIGIGADGTVWIVGNTSVSGGYNIRYWSGSKWLDQKGGLTNIAVGPAGRPVGVNSGHNIFFAKDAGIVDASNYLSTAAFGWLLHNRSHNQCVNLPDDANSDGGHMVPVACARGDDGQAWVVESLGGGNVRIRNLGYNKCLNLQGSHNADRPNVWDCVSHPDQTWKITSLGGSDVRIKNQHHNKCLNLQPGNQFNVWDCVNHPDQTWRIE